MSGLQSVELFAGLSGAEERRVVSLLAERSVAAGEVLLRRGEEGRALYVIKEGSVRVDPPGSTPTHLGAGEVFGELSLLSGSPVSARVTATRPTELSVLERAAFLELFDELPGLRLAATDLLVERLRRREATEQQAKSERVRVELPGDTEDGLGDALQRLLVHYDPRVRVETSPGAQVGASAQPEEPSLTVEFVRSGADAPTQTLDAVVFPVGAPGTHRDDVQAPHRLGVRWNADDRARDPREPWSLPVSPREVAYVLAHGEWSRQHATRAPGLDRVARWVTRRWVGVAFGAGAALGFAHYGVLVELEEAGLAIDTLSGTSMGGIAALLRGLAGSARATIPIARAATGSNRIARRPAWFPRASFLSARPARREATRVAKTSTLADLSLPVSVVASDLLRGAKVTIDRGSVVEAMLATSAVPGAFPPVRWGDHLLVDGGLVSRLPIDLLADRRCGLRIAVNVVAPPDPNGELEEQLRHFLGFRAALGAAWDFLAWWQGAAEAAEADVLIEPDTRGKSGFDFDEFDALVEVGRTAGRQALPATLHRAGALGIL